MVDLDIRLDDPADLREASTGAAFALIVDRFHQDIEETLPASAMPIGSPTAVRWSSSAAATSRFVIICARS